MRTPPRHLQLFGYQRVARLSVCDCFGLRLSGVPEEVMPGRAVALASMGR